MSSLLEKLGFKAKKAEVVLESVLKIPSGAPPNRKIQRAMRIVQSLKNLKKDPTTASKVKQLEDELKVLLQEFSDHKAAQAHITKIG